MKSLALFKRSSKGVINPGEPGYKDAPFYFRFNHRTVSYLKCTKSNVAEEALKIARGIYQRTIEDAIKGVVASKPAPAPLALPTVDQFIAAYLIAPTEAKSSTRAQNVAVLRKMLQVANPGCTSVGAELRIDSINEQLASKWFAAALAANTAVEGDQTQVMHNKNSSNSEFAKVASMFHDSLLDHYRENGMFFAGMEEFRKKGKARKFRKVCGRGVNPYNPPPQSVVDAVLASWLTITDRNLFIAAGFALAFGLRKSETRQIRWGYLQLLHGGSPGLSGSAKVKNKSGWIEGRALDPFYSQFVKRLDQMGWRGADDELVLTGGIAETKNKTWERLSAWLVALGWTTDKKSHALRAYSGSKVYQRYGLDSAQLYLHHANPITTLLYYSHFASKWPMDDEEKQAMPERWAAKVITNILPLPIAVGQ